MIVSIFAWQWMRRCAYRDDELPVAFVRKLVGSTKIVGVSAKTVARGVEAENEGADYLGVGAIFPTTTKDSPLTSLQTLSEIAAAVTIPVVAIGGIKEENIEQLMGTEWWCFTGQ